MGLNPIRALKLYVHQPVGSIAPVESITPLAATQV